VDPFNVKNFRNDFRKRVVEAEDGVATIDWVVLLAALTGLGVAMLDVTGEPLGIHAQTVRGELQDNSFETAWADNIPVGPSGEGLPDIITTSGSTGGGTTGGGTTGGGTTGVAAADHRSRSDAGPRSDARSRSHSGSRSDARSGSRSDPDGSRSRSDP
jgi:hypothetical protein